MMHMPMIKLTLAVGMSMKDISSLMPINIERIGGITMTTIKELVERWVIPAMFVISLYGFFMGWFE